MRRIELLAGMLCTGLLCAQVVSPPEIRDPELRELQEKHFAELKAAAVTIASHQFPYRFYFSRTLDLDQDQQKTRDQRSIQFAKYGHQTVVQITGNYYAAYSDELMKREERARRTFDHGCARRFGCGSGAGPRPNSGGSGGEACPCSHRCRAGTHTRRLEGPPNCLSGNSGQDGPRVRPDSALRQLRSAGVRELSQRYLPAAFHRDDHPVAGTVIPLPRGRAGI